MQRTTIAVIIVFALLTQAGGAAEVDSGKAMTLRLAIEDLIATFGDEYPRGPEYLSLLERVGAA